MVMNKQKLIVCEMCGKRSLMHLLEVTKELYGHALCWHCVEVRALVRGEKCPLKPRYLELA